MKSKKNSRFLSFISFISIFGVMIGVTAMIVVLSVMDGFETELKKRLMSSDLHILISPTEQVEGFSRGVVPQKALENSGALKQLKGDSRVVDVWPVLSTEAILKTGRKVAGVLVKGVSDERLKRLESQLTEKTEPQLLVEREGPHAIHFPGLYIGQELAFELGIIPGDRISLISPTETEGPLASVPRLKSFVVEGIYSSGLPEQELQNVFTKASSVESFLRKRDVVSNWEVTVRDFSVASQVAESVRGLAKGFRVQDWIQMNAHLFASLKLERIAMFVILAFIIVVASFNIVTTLTLMVLEKKKEISILKAMGARDSQVAAIFLSEGLLIGGVGVGGGVILGLGLCTLLERYEFITLPDIYYDRTLPVSFEPIYYILIAVCAFLIVLLACLYPSRRAARINPLDGIRFG